MCDGDSNKKELEWDNRIYSSAGVVSMCCFSIVSGYGIRCIRLSVLFEILYDSRLLWIFAEPLSLSLSLSLSFFCCAAYLIVAVLLLVFSSCSVFCVVSATKRLDTCLYVIVESFSRQQQHHRCTSSFIVRNKFLLTFVCIGSMELENNKTTV